jgi:hypothetical protein
MKIERRRLTKAELASVTSRRPVVRRIPAPDKADSPGPNAPGPQGPVESTVTYNTSREAGSDKTTRGPSGPVERRKTSDSSISEITKADPTRQASTELGPIVSTRAGEV